MNIVVIGLSHHSSPVELRERFAFAEAKIPDALKSLRESGIAGEAVILSTCNRVEIYAATALEPAKAFAELKNFSRHQRFQKQANYKPTSARMFFSLSSTRRGPGRGGCFPNSNPLAPTLSPLGRGEGVDR